MSETRLAGQRQLTREKARSVSSVLVSSGLFSAQRVTGMTSSGLPTTNRGRYR
jgi:hypothetical protein